MLLAFSWAEWQQGLAETLPHMKTFLDLVGQFARRYRSAKDTHRSLDFADLERHALKVLSDHGKPSSTAMAYHRRFAHVLVDEYQDINELQDEILSLVSHERAEARAKLHAEPVQRRRREAEHLSFSIGGAEAVSRSGKTACAAAFCGVR